MIENRQAWLDWVEAITELKREKNIRASVYLRMVQDGRMKAKDAQARMGALDKAIAILEAAKPKGQGEWS